MQASQIPLGNREVAITMTLNFILSCHLQIRPNGDTIEIWQ